MPKAMEAALKKEANKHKDWSRERKAAFIYGTMHNKTGWVRGKNKK